MPDDTRGADEYKGQIRATILAGAREDPETGERLQSGAPTDAELRVINKRFARATLSAEDVYVLSVYMSGTGLDSYGTHQDLSSLRNYRQDVTRTDAVPILSHHGGYMGEYMDPIGRWFAASVDKLDQGGERELLIYDSGRERYILPGADDAGGRYMLGKHYRDQGYSLLETGYLLRGASPNGRPIEDVIRRVDGGTLRDTSIGFTTNPAIAPGAFYRCDVCGLDLFDRRCAHIPLLRYQDPYSADQTVLATATVMGARQAEGSLVWRGSYPGAFVARAARLYGEGQVATQDVALLEHYYETRILGSRYISIPKGADTMPPELEAGRELDEGQERDSVPAAADADSLLERAQDPEQPETAERDEPEGPDVETLERDLAAATAAAEAIRDQVAATLATVGLEPPRDPQDAVRMLGVLAAEGMYSRGQLVDACVAERVRATEGGGAGFDADAYRKRLGRLPIQELQDELRDQAGASGSAWTPARQIATDIRQRQAEDQAEEAAAQPRTLTAAEIYSLRGA